LKYRSIVGYDQICKQHVFLLNVNKVYCGVNSRKICLKLKGNE